MKTARMLLLTAGAGSTVAACGAGSGNASLGTPASNPTAFVLQEWSITAPTTPLRAGEVLATAINCGGETHELVIVRFDDTVSLPTKSDDSVDEDKFPEVSKPGEIGDIRAKHTLTKTIDLPSGTYVAICNLVGQGSGMGNGTGMGRQISHLHYRLGMVAKFTVA